MTTATASKLDLPVPVLEVPHWRVVIHPTVYVRDRVRSLGDCWAAVEASRVSLRGWDYPHVDDGPPLRNGDSIASWVNWGSHLEYWRFWQSGQFLHLFGFWEDREEPSIKGRREALLGRAGIEFEPSGDLEPTGVIYTLSEIFEFAARLATRIDVHEGVRVTIELRDVANRILLSREWARIWTNLYKLDVPSIGETWEIDALALRASRRELALDAAVWLFDKFGWNPPRKILAADQERLYTRRF